MCSCQNCKTNLNEMSPCTKCKSDVFNEPCHNKDNIPEYKRNGPKLRWNCKYCINDPIGGVYDPEETQTPVDLEDILADIEKLKHKLNNLLNDMVQVKTDLIDLKETTTSAHSYMTGVNDKVKNLENRIVKLDKKSCNLYTLKQTISNFENPIDDKKYWDRTTQNNVYVNQKHMLLYDAPEACKDVLPKDQNSFIAKVQLRLRNAPKLILSRFSTDQNKKSSLLRCEV
ncbi:unnamed protein product [Chilo suppressalis]|uniref:Uncharacterized protein n=1 Tax=Chilo suppressalis TaxID=168631 RepID=A0ABN8L233_CHISP|nr:unnamed protein product [Chilo suppressalis]